MSTTIASNLQRAPMTLTAINEKFEHGEPLVMVTAYDYPSARACERADVDLVLVGDSGAQVMLGYESTALVSLDEMVMLTAAARRGCQTPLLVSDLPFGSFEQSDAQAIASAIRLVQEGRCDLVKLERGNEICCSRVRAIVSAGVPVVGHIGLTPQTATALGGYRAQGRSAERALNLVREARALEAAGCCMLVLEAIPAEIAQAIAQRIGIPTIGIGAGAATAGQVLVFHDLLGIREGHGARFVKRYDDLLDTMVAGVATYADDVRAKRFPGPEHCYSITDRELSVFHGCLAAEDS